MSLSNRNIIHSLKVRVLSSLLPAVFQEEQSEENEPLLEQTFSWPILYISTLLQCVHLDRPVAPWLGGMDHVLRTEGVLVSSRQEMLKKN